MPENNGGDAEPEAPPEVHSILDTTKDRVAEILAATDRAATGIVEAAKAEAQEVVAEAHRQATEVVDSRMQRISTLIERLLAKAGTLDSEFEQLRDLVRQSNDALAEELGLSPQRQPAQPASEPEPAPVATQPAAVGQPTAAATDVRAEAVKLLAIQMIATGHSVERASERLKSEFQVKDPAAVLAEIGAPLDQG